mmetsp:Transcript_11339/g.29118  ORF Transcript_11339/g.29118 Transcript_11339/m.29118 type:complete len:348 (+) Transcript_11339:718-1761(+)
MRDQAFPGTCFTTWENNDMHRPTTLKLKPYPSRPISSARHASNPQPTFSHLPAETPPTQCPPAAASTFSSSMEIAVTLLEENAVTGERLKCCHAYLTFVALKSLKKADNPNPKALPHIMATGAEEEAILAGAGRRRERRLAKREAAKRAVRADTSLKPLTHFSRDMVIPDTTLERKAASAKGGTHFVEPRASLSHLTHVVMPQNANVLGITFGGQVLSWVEQAAYLSATRLNCSGHMLTVAMDAVSFKEPTKVGDILYFTAVVTAVFKTSVEVQVSVFGEHPFEDEKEPFFVLDAFVTLVSVDDDMNPQQLHFVLQPASENQVHRMEDAKQRREERLELREGRLMVA